MKKVLLLVAVAAFVVAGFSSCKKCTDCVVKDSTGATFYTYPEYCANSADVNTFKTACQTTYSSTAGYSVTCTDK